MSKTIDERVVEMRFDNQQFESGVKTSLNTLDKLKRGLDLDGAARSFETIGSAAQTVSTKFSALETIAVGALLKIGNQAVTAGEQLLKSLTVDNISAGWDKLAKKTTSVATLVSQGYDMETVEAQLERLNWFTDETSYNFTDMVDSIAKFTASGQDLEGSVTALEGIALWASLSGQNATKASSAMYQLSQAMGSGIMRKEDYKSIQNLSMDTTEFREKALEAGVALGTLQKNADGTYKSLVAVGEDFTVAQFAEHLTEDAWFTSDVMMKVYNEYSAAVGQIYDYAAEKGVTASEAIEAMGDEVDEFGLKAFRAGQEAKTWEDVIDSVKDAVSTGWMNTFETIFGNYEEQRVLWTDLANELYDVFAEGGNARNEMLGEALSISGFTKFTDTLAESGIEIEAYQEKLTELADSKGVNISDLISEYGSLEEAVQNGAISTDLLREAALACGETLESVNLTDLSTSIDAVIGEVDQLSGRQHLISAFWKAWEGARTVLGTFKEGLHEIFPETTAEQVYNFAQSLDEMATNFNSFIMESEEGQTMLTQLKNTFKGIFAIVDIVKEAFSGLWRALAPARESVGGLLSELLGASSSFGEWLTALDETIKENDIFYNAFVKIIDYIESAIVTIQEFAEAVREKLNLPTIDELTESVREFAASLKERFEITSLDDAKDKISELTDSVKEKFDCPGLELLSAIFENLKVRASQAKEAIFSMKDTIVEAFGKVDGAISESKFLSVITGIWNVAMEIGKAIGSFLGNSIANLVGSLEGAEFDGILDFLNMLASGGLVVAVTRLLGSVQDTVKSGSGLVDGIKESLEAILGSFKGVVDGISATLDTVKGSLKAWQEELQAKALLKIATAIALIAAALLVLSTIDSEKLQSSLAAVAVTFVELIGAVGVMDKLNIDSKGINKTSTAMIKIGAALLILSLAVKNLSELDSEELTTGLVGIGVLLAEIAAFLKLATFEKGATKTATAMVIFAAAILILASAVEDLSALSWEELAKGLVAVGVLLAEVDVFLNTAKFSGKSLVTAAGIVVLAAAIKVLASAAQDFASMTWEEIAKGLTSIGLLLAEIVAFTKLTGNAKSVVSIGLAMIEIAAAMKIFASAVEDFASMSWGDIAKGLVAMGGALLEVAVALKVIPTNMVTMGVGLIAVGAALKIIASALTSMGGMSWEEIAKGLVTLGVALGELAIALNLMNGTLSGSAALLVAAAAILILTPALKSLGGMSLGEIVTALVALAGAFTVIGVAAAVLSPLVGTILGLSAALLLIGVSTLAAGAGLVLIGAGLTSVSVGLTALVAVIPVAVTAIVAGLAAIVLGIAELIPALVEQFGLAIVAFCGAIVEGAPAIAEAIEAVVLSLIDVIVTCIPAIVEGVMELVTQILDALVTYTPEIIDSVMEFLIEVLEGIARNMPQLIQAAMDVLGSFFSGVLTALGQIDVDSLLKGVTALGLLTGIVAALSAIAISIPAATVGVLGLGVIITELALVLAAIGALAQISGLEWFIGEGGNLLEAIGTAIGQFFGGIVGGFATGVSGSFPEIAEDLSAFMTNLQPFVDGASKIKTDLLTGVATLTGAIMLITAANLLESITSWITGGSSLADFGKELVPFGESMVDFADSIADLDVDVVSKAATAGKTLAEMAATLPNSGGVLGFFTGDNDMNEFGGQLVAFGSAMMDFSRVVKDLDTDAVQNASTAGKAMAEMANTLPNTGGAVAFFSGDNDMATFGEQLVPFGKAMKDYSLAVDGIKVEAVTESATAGAALIELANTLPNTGGVVSWFTGDNDLATFGEQIVIFGKAMKDYSDAVYDIQVDAITNSTTAGKALAELADTLPNTGGIVSWFTGNNDLGNFGENIVLFGEAMKSYSESVFGINADDITASATAAKALSELEGSLSNTGGLISFFTGDNDLANFAKGLTPFGEAMKEYSDSVHEINADDILDSADAAKELADLESILPNVSGVVSWFAGDNDLGKFADGIVPFGEAMKAYGEAVKSIDADSITASATAGKSLAELQEELPSIGGVVGFFTGESDMAVFAEGLVAFGEALSSYGDSVDGLKSSEIEASIATAESLSNLARELQNLNTSGMTNFEQALRDMARSGISGFTSTLTGSDAEIQAAINSMMSCIQSTLNNDAEFPIESINDMMLDMADCVREKSAEIDTSIVTMMSRMISSIRSNISNVRSAMNAVMDAISSSAKRNNNDFYELGVDICQGLINGMNAKSAAVGTAGWKLGRAALIAAKEAVDSNSPSKEFIYLGQNIAEGLAIGINDGIVLASQASSGMMDEVLAAANQGIDAWEEWLETKQYYDEISLKEELAGWEQLQKMYAENSEERIKIDKEVYRVQNELVAATYQYSIDWIEQEKFYNRLSTEEELAAYERMQTRYMEGSEERIEIDKQIYTLRNQLVDESYQNSMDWIEEEKYYSRLSLAAELAAYKRVQNRYESGTDERKDLDREVYDLEQEIYEAQQQYIEDVQSAQEEANDKRIDLEEEYADKVKSINEQLTSDIKSLNDEYESSLESRMDAIYDSYGLFDKVDDLEDVSGSTLLDNLQGQVERVNEWRRTLDNLTARGIDDELIEELEEMGPSALSQLQALEAMSDTELDRYVALWSLKHVQAREQATEELEGLRKETDEQIEQLKADAEAELEAYRQTWQTEMDQIDTDLAADLEELRKTFGEKVGLIETDTTTTMQETVDAAQKILTAAGWDTTGQQIVTGLTSGITDNKQTLLDSITNMALEAVAAVQETLDINSPSRVFRELGNYTTLGFVQGIEDYAAQSYNAASSVGENATSGLSDAISTVADYLNGDMVMQPTIRPVLDLSDISNGANMVNTMFTDGQLMAMAGQTNFAFNANNGSTKTIITVDNDGVVQELRSLRSEMAEMSERMNKMQVVLDTGVLVGQTVGMMDAALGQRQTYRGRAN